MTGDEPTEPTRLESEDEVLDASEPQVRHRPLPVLKTFEAGFRRYRKTVRALTALAVVAASAALGALATHGADVHGQTSAADDKVLIRLIGGGGSLGLDDEQPPSVPYQANAFLRFTVRNDGLKTVTIVSTWVSQPGVEIIQSDSDITAIPGVQDIIAVSLKVNCADPALPERPDVLHLMVRSADGGLVPESLPMPAPPGPITPAELELADSTSSALDDYKVLCGQSDNRVLQDVTYKGVTSGASATNPAFTYALTVANPGPAPKVVTLSGETLPGIQTTSTITGKLVIQGGTTADVSVTYRATDCAKLRTYLLSFQGDGIGIAVTVTGNDTLSVDQADPRFPSVPQPLDVADSSLGVYYGDFLSQLAIACPNLL
jgi:hypothetical protein